MNERIRIFFLGGATSRESGSRSCSRRGCPLLVQVPTISTSRNRRVGERRQTLPRRQLCTRAKRAGQQARIPLPPMPVRPHRVNHMSCRKTKPGRDYRLPDGQTPRIIDTPNLSTRFKKLRPSRPMNRAIHTTATEQGGVRGVDDGVDREGRNISVNGPHSVPGSATSGRAIEICGCSARKALICASGSG